MPSDLEPPEIEPPRSILSLIMDGMTLYACCQHSHSGSVKLTLGIHNRDTSQPDRQESRHTHAQNLIAQAHRAPHHQSPRSTPDSRSNPARDPINRGLRLPVVALIAKAALTFPFWSSGLTKLFSFESGVAEMARVGLEPPALFNLATIIVQLGGSALIILHRWVWLGAGALGIFTAMTVILVHRFWAMAEEPFRTIALHTTAEHVGLIGGLVAISILAAQRTGAELKVPGQQWVSEAALSRPPLHAGDDARSECL